MNDEAMLEDVEDIIKTSQEMNLSMREILWTLNPKNDNLHDFAKYSENYADHFFRKTNIKLVVKSDYISDAEMQAETKRNLLLCFKEALNNIYKHSQAETVQLSFAENEEIFSVELADDGIGIHPEKQTGNGLRNMKERKQKINGNFTVETSGKGTSVKLILF